MRGVLNGELACGLHDAVFATWERDDAATVAAGDVQCRVGAFHVAHHDLVEAAYGLQYSF